MLHHDGLHEASTPSVPHLSVNLPSSLHAHTLLAHSSLGLNVYNGHQFTRYPLRPVIQSPRTGPYNQTIHSAIACRQHRQTHADIRNLYTDIHTYINTQIHKHEADEERRRLIRHRQQLMPASPCPSPPLAVTSYSSVTSFHLLRHSRHAPSGRQHAGVSGVTGGWRAHAVESKHAYCLHTHPTHTHQGGLAVTQPAH